MNRCCFLFALLLFSRVAIAQTPTADTTGVEYSTEIAEPAPANPTRRYRREQQMKEKALMNRSRYETTLIRLGTYQMTGAGGVLALRDYRPEEQSSSTSGILIGIDHKFSSLWGGHLSGAWLFNPRRTGDFVKTPAGLVNFGADYYFLAHREQRRGRNPNNFYQQAYLTAEGFLPFNDKVQYTDNLGVTKTYHLQAYQQAFSVGFGIHNIRTRLFYYNIVWGMAYLISPDPGLHHAVQPMLRVSLGLGF
jgi:hypothetical protein